MTAQGTRGGAKRIAVLGAALSLIAAWPAADGQTTAAADDRVTLDENAVDESAGDLACYKITTPRATYFLEKEGAGLSSLIDRDGNDWLGFHPEPGSGSNGEYRGFPNAVHQQMGNYFHPKNAGTQPSQTKVEYAGPERVTISAVSSNDAWACRYDFYPTHCTFTMTKMPAGYRFWVLYEGTPGGEYDDGDWWMTSAAPEKTLMTTDHEGDIAGPEWIAFGDANGARSLVLFHHHEDEHPDRFYQMRHEMTVFGFGRQRMEKFLDAVPRSVSIGLVESTDHEEIGTSVQAFTKPALERE
jgi:hypothetical protein